MVLFLRIFLVLIHFTINQMVNGLHLYSAFIQSALHSPFHSYTHSCTNNGGVHHARQQPADRMMLKDETGCQDPLLLLLLASVLLFLLAPLLLLALPLQLLQLLPLLAPLPHRHGAQVLAGVKGHLGGWDTIGTSTEQHHLSSLKLKTLIPPQQLNQCQVSFN